MSFFSAQDPQCNAETGCDPVETIIIPRTADIGGYEVHRALPSKLRRMVGPFIFWDQMGPGEFLSGQGLDVRPHPHIGLATVTYLFQGTLDHRDSTGVFQTIQPGDVNLMKAGRGIVHSERSGPEDRKAQRTLAGIQSWIALPQDQEEDAPMFAHTDEASLPQIEDGGVRARLIMGGMLGAKSPVATFSDTIYADINMKAGSKMPIPKTIEERALYALSGTIEIGGIQHAPMQLLILRPGDEITVTAITDVRMMLLGGAAMDGPRHIWWNFVSSRKDRLEQAKQDWREGRFEKVPGEHEFIPLPEA